MVRESRLEEANRLTAFQVDERVYFHLSLEAPWARLAEQDAAHGLVIVSDSRQSACLFPKSDEDRRAGGRLTEPVLEMPPLVLSR